MTITKVRFEPADHRLLAWHLRLTLQAPVPSRVCAVQVDGAAADDWVLLQGGQVVPTLPEGGKHGVRKPARHVSSASAGGQFLDGRGAPEIAIFVPWQADRQYALELELEETAGTRSRLTASATAPSAGAFPFAGWPRHRVFHFRETAGLERRREPVEIMLSAYGDEVGDWNRELRLGAYDPWSRSTTAVPFQVMRQTRANHTSSKRRELCTTAWITVFLDLPAQGDLLLVCAWGKADAEPADTAAFSPDLRIEPDDRGPRTVENAFYTAGLCPRSGQLAWLKSRQAPPPQPGQLPDEGFFFSPGGNREQRFLHYNPDLWIPDRTWTHASDWNPPPYSTTAAGPLALRTRRWGDLPHLHGVRCCVEYTFYAWTPWIRTRTVLEVNAELTTNAIRNEEIVINEDQVDRCAWKEADGRIHDQSFVPDPALPSGIVAVIGNDSPWVAFYRRDTGAGIGGIRLTQQATTRGAGERAYWNSGTLIVDYGWGFKYWSRSLIYGTGDFWPDREYAVEPGLLYTDECAYMPLVVQNDGAEQFGQLEAAEARLRQPVQRIWSGSGPY